MDFKKQRPDSPFFFEKNKVFLYDALYPFRPAKTQSKKPPDSNSLYTEKNSARKYQPPDGHSVCIFIQISV